MSLAMDHVGIAVRSLSEGCKVYEALGAPAGEPELVEAEQVRVAMVALEGGRVELLEPVGEDSALGRFLARRGEGIHHIALRVADVDEQFARMKQSGVRLVSDAVQTGAGGHRYFFVHPAAAGGVLLEIVGA